MGGILEQPVHDPGLQLSVQAGRKDWDFPCVLSVRQEKRQNLDHRLRLRLALNHVFSLVVKFRVGWRQCPR